VWEKTYYSGVVEEGSANERIVRVNAVDKDGSTVYSQVCQYHVLTPDMPFEIDENGKNHFYLDL